MEPQAALAYLRTSADKLRLLTGINDRLAALRHLEYIAELQESAFLCWVRHHNTACAENYQQAEMELSAARISFDDDYGQFGFKWSTPNIIAEAALLASQMLTEYNDAIAALRELRENDATMLGLFVIADRDMLFLATDTKEYNYDWLCRAAQQPELKDVLDKYASLYAASHPGVKAIHADLPVCHVATLTLIIAALINEGRVTSGDPWDYNVLAWCYNGENAQYCGDFITINEHRRCSYKFSTFNGSTGATDDITYYHIFPGKCRAPIFFTGGLR